MDAPQAPISTGIPEPQPAPATGGEPTFGVLSRVRTAARWLLVLERLGWIVAGAIAAVVAVGVIDYVLRAPSLARLVVLLAGAALLVWTVRRRLWPALRFNPSLEDVALRLERSEQGRELSLPGRLASAVGLSGAPPADAVSRGLAAPVIADASGRMKSLRLVRALRPGGAARSVLVALLAAGAVAAFTSVYPLHAWIGARRVLLPLAGAQWPKRTAVADATLATHHPLDGALLLQAGLVRSSRPAAATDVQVRHRLVDPSGRPGPWRSAAMTAQDRRIPVTTPGERGEPVTADAALFERVIEPGALTAGATVSGDDWSVEYTFATDDDSTPPRAIRLVTPPAVVSARAVITPPAYLGNAASKAHDLGAGADERATVAGVLEGSAVELTIRFNKPLPWPGREALTGDQPALGREVARLLESQGPALAVAAPASAGTGELGDPAPGATGDAWVLRFRAAQSLRVPVSPRDGFGVPATSEAAFRVEVRPDRAPEAVVVQPDQDIDVLASATVGYAVEGRDDLALREVSATVREARRPAGSVGAAAEPGPPTTLLRETFAVGAEAATGPTLSKRLGGRIELSGMGLAPGDELWLQAVATDAYEIDGQRHPAAESPVRRVRIISPEQLAEQAWAELSVLRRSAMQASERQAAASQTLTRDPQPPSEPRLRSAARDQAGVTDAVGRMEQALEQLNQRLERAVGKPAQQSGDKPAPAQDGQPAQPAQPRPEQPLDPEVAAAMANAAETLRAARESSSRASRGLQESQQSRAEGDQPAADEAQRRAQQSQDNTQDALDRLAQALDRGQDAFAQRRAIERLIKDQESLRKQTEELARQTTGRTAEELTGQQREQAERLAGQQDELAQRAQEALRQMEQKADQLRQSDPQTASALEQAARRGQRQALAEQMQQAARQVRRNQQQSAGQQQQRAQQTMQQMLDEMKDAARDRDAALRRLLASLVETIDALIADQTAQLDAAQRARLNLAAGPLAFAGLDQPMMRLNSATLAAVEQARAGGREARPVADALDKAAEEQSAAVVAIRATPVDAKAVIDRETGSLEQLNRAKRAAEKAQDQAEQRDRERRRSELRQAYQQLLDRQNDLIVQTRALAEKEQNRRTRASARELGTAQDELRLAAADLLSKTEGLGESDMFPFAHRRIDTAATAAVEQLQDGQATALVAARQSVVARTLRALVEALDEAQKREQEFRQPQGEEQGGGGGGGGGGQQQALIQMIAELRLVRQLQRDALTSTREAADGKDPALINAATADAAELQGQLTEKAAELLRKIEQMQSGGVAPAPGGAGGGGRGGGGPPQAPGAAGRGVGGSTGEMP